jgi:pimeloyl-ACP methyl ester carboxylesterase
MSEEIADSTDQMQSTGITREDPFFFALGEDRLFAFLHHPADASDNAIVFCHALAEEKLWSHRIYVNFSRAMATAGFYALRFDMRGEGDSDVSFAQSTVESRVADTLRAVEVLHERIPDLKRVTLIGHRFGGSIACRAALEAGDKIQALVVWDPILDGRDYFMQLLRSNLATQLATDGKVTRTREVLVQALLDGEPITVDGYELTGQLYREFEELTAEKTFGLLQHPCLMIGQKKDDPQLDAISSANPLVQAATASEPPFWRETRKFHQRAPAFTQTSLEWIKGLHA